MVNTVRIQVTISVMTKDRSKLFFNLNQRNQFYLIRVSLIPRKNYFIGNESLLITMKIENLSKNKRRNTINNNRRTLIISIRKCTQKKSRCSVSTKVFVIITY